MLAGAARPRGVAGQVEYGAPAGAASGPAMEKIRGPGRSRRRRYAPQSPDTKQARRQNEGSRSAAAQGKAAPPATWQRFAQDPRDTPVRQEGTVLRTRWLLAGRVPTSKDQYERLRRVIGGLANDQLDRPSAGDPDRTVRYSILHALHDEACHCGEAYLLLKVQARERA